MRIHTTMDRYSTTIQGDYCKSAFRNNLDEDSNAVPIPLMVPNCVEFVKENSNMSVLPSVKENIKHGSHSGLKMDYREYRASIDRSNIAANNKVDKFFENANFHNEEEPSREKIHKDARSKEHPPKETNEYIYSSSIQDHEAKRCITSNKDKLGKIDEDQTSSLNIKKDFHKPMKESPMDVDCLSCCMNCMNCLGEINCMDCMNCLKNIVRGDSCVRNELGVKSTLSDVNRPEEVSSHIDISEQDLPAPYPPKHLNFQGQNNPFVYPFDYPRMIQAKGYNNTFHFLTMRFFRGLKLGVQIYLPIHLLPIIIFKRKQFFSSPKNAIAIIHRFLVNLTKSSLFISSLQSAFVVVVLCLSQLFGVDHPLTAAFGGFLSGSSILLENKSRRMELALYCVPRCIEALDSYLKYRKVLTWSKEKENLFWRTIFSFSFGALVLLYHVDARVMKPSIRGALYHVIGQKL